MFLFCAYSSGGEVRFNITAQINKLASNKKNDE
jgi:hypothetical protein